MKKLIRLFEYSAAALLLITALAKFASSGGQSKILGLPDPIFQIQYRHLFVMVGLAELLVARMCIFDKRAWWRAGSVAWLVSHFFLYRAGLVWMHHLEPCPCLGTLTDVIPVDAKTISLIMRGILYYLAIGSYGSLIWLAWQRSGSQPSPLEPTASNASPTA